MCSNLPFCVIPVCGIADVVRVILDDGKLSNLDGVAGGEVVKEAKLAHEIIGKGILVIVLGRVFIREVQVREGGEDEDIRIGRRDRICRHWRLIVRSNSSFGQRVIGKTCLP